MGFDAIIGGLAGEARPESGFARSVSPGGGRPRQQPALTIFRLNARLSSATPPASAATPLAVLGEVFGYESFRGIQADVVEHVADGGDALVLMPTGAGKSLCFQVPAIVRHRAGRGVTVAQPAHALMQTRSARSRAGVQPPPQSTLESDDAARIERERIPPAVPLYAAPERIATPRMRAAGSLHDRGLLVFAIASALFTSGARTSARLPAPVVLHERYPGVPRVA